MALAWMQWADVNIGYNNLESDKITLNASALIGEACQVVLDDLSGHLDTAKLTTAVGVPAQLKRLAIYKARELASVMYYGAATSDEKNPEAAYHRAEYAQLLASIRDGFVEVDGYMKPSAEKRVSFI